MISTETAEFVLRVLTLMAKHDVAGSSAVWWRTDGTYAPITFFVNCNDVFAWASADCETLTPDNIDLLESTLDEIASMEKVDAVSGPSIYDAFDLFCARIRKTRPQGRSYDGYHESVWPLFDACGPERSLSEPGNTPRKQQDGEPT